MKEFSCACKCRCGNCSKRSCDCNCHQLDALSDYEIMDIMIKVGKKKLKDVLGKTRNQLMRDAVQLANPMDVIKEGVKRINKSLKNNQSNHSDCKDKSKSGTKLFEHVVKKGNTNGIARLFALDDKNKRNTMKHEQKTKPKTIKKKTIKKSIAKSIAKPKKVCRMS